MNVAYVRMCWNFCEFVLLHMPRFQKGVNLFDLLLPSYSFFKGLFAFGCAPVNLVYFLWLFEWVIIFLS